MYAEDPGVKEIEQLWVEMGYPSVPTPPPPETVGKVTKKGNPGSLEHPPTQLMSRGGLVKNHLWGQILDHKKVHVYYPNTSKRAS